MVSLTYYDEHVAWQQRVQKEVTQAHRFQKTNTDSFKQSQSPIKRPNNRSSVKSRSKSTVYSNLPSANINLGAMNVYAEVRGKYSRNANKTINQLPQVSGVVSRPSTSGSLVSYSRRFQVNEEAKKPESEEVRSLRPLKEEVKVAVKGRKGEKIENEKKREGEVQDLLVIEHDKEDGNDNTDEEDNAEEVDKVEDLENNEGEEDKKTEVSFKTTSSQRRYIEELEKMLKDERVRRIEAEDKLERLSQYSKRTK